VKAVKLALLLSLCTYLLIIGPFSAHLKNRPLQIKVGYPPEAAVIKCLTADQRYLAADWIVLKVILYFGELLEKAHGKNLYASDPDYPGMFRMLQTGLRIDPYNADAYYFAQAVYTWDVGRFREVNNMLEYGMKYRRWDFQIPFFAGFNSAYFLKDYKTAAKYTKIAAEIVHEPQFANLTARYFYEAGENDLAIMFLDVMKKGARDENEKKLYTFRRTALAAAKAIQDAVNGYQRRHGRLPATLQELVAGGYLRSIPEDPYGGKFYLDGNGKVRTTSKFSFAGAHASGNMNR
jgi:hypothetical protein